MRNTPLTPDTTPTSLLRETIGTAAAGLLVIAFCAALVLHDPGYFWQDDNQSFQLAGYWDVARSWSEGEFPLLSPYSWNCGALAGEYQYGVFSVFLTACVLTVFSLGLPLPLAAAALSITHLAVLATGAFRLGRRRGLTVELALLVALVASLNGWIVIWGAKNWFSALAGFAWLPWLWWGLDRALDMRNGPARFLPAGFVLYLVVAAGWPLAVFASGILSLWFTLRLRVEYGGWRLTWPVPAAWALGLGLSAPAWLMFVEYLGSTARGQTSALALSDCWVVPLASLPGFALPALVTPWNVFGTLKPHRCAELTGGLVPLAILLATVCHRGRAFLWRFRWESGLCLLLLALSVLPGFGNFRWSFRWLPFFFLVLAVLAGHALAELRTQNESSPNPGRWAAFLVVLAWLHAIALGMDPTASTFWQGAAFTAISLLWAVLEKCFACRLTWMPGAVVLLTAALTYAPIDRSLEVPVWDLAPAPASSLDPQVSYLGVYVKSDILRPDSATPLGGARGTGPELLHGNVGMYGGVRVVNGYSPLKPRGLAHVIGFASHGHLGIDTVLSETAVADGVGLEIGRRLLLRESGPNGLLEQMGVDGLIVSEQFAVEAAVLQAQGWQLVTRVAGAQVFHRTSRSPRVWAVEQAARVAVRSESRTSVIVDVTSQSRTQDSLVVFARPWYPGYRAEWNGVPVPVELVNSIQPTVRLPAGATGRLTLIYRPHSLVLGCWLAAATGVAALVFAACGLALVGAKPQATTWKGGAHA